MGVPRWRGGALSDWEGCGVGCFPCMDHPGSVGVPGSRPHVIDGNRWLRPIDRDATGMMRDLQSAKLTHVEGIGTVDMRANFVPWTRTRFLRGACFDNFGFECFRPTVCACWPGTNDREARLNEGCGGIPARGSLVGYFPDISFYKGHKWPLIGSGEGQLGDLPGDRLFCRSFKNRDIHAREVEIMNERLGLPTFLRTGGQASAWPDSASLPPFCTANPLVGCVANVPNSDCESGFGFGGGQENYIASAFVNDWATVQARWGEWVDDNADIQFGDIPRLRQPKHRTDGRAPKLQAVVDIQNRVLRHITTQDFPTFRDGLGVMRFDRLDYDAVSFSSQTNNSRIDSWGRSFGLTEVDDAIWQGCVILEQSPPLGTLFMKMPDCYLKKSGCPVNVNVIIHKVDIRMGFVPAYVDRKPPGNVTSAPALFPYVRLWIEGQMAYRAYLTEPCGDVEIFNVGDPGHSSGGGTTTTENVDIVRRRDKPSDNDWVPIRFTIPNAPEATTDVLIAVRGVGFDFTGMRASITVDGVQMGTFIGGVDGAPSCIQHSEQIIVPKDVWNQATVGGDADVSVVVSFEGVQNSECPEEFVEVGIAYSGIHRSGSRFCHLPAEVSDGDRIVFVHNGVVLDYVPEKVNWWGFLGEAGHRKTTNHYRTGFNHGMDSKFCCEIRKDLGRITVWSKPTQWGSKPSNIPNLYEGALTLDFSSHTAECPE